MHDELGQALTAVKANLSALRENPEPARVEDCMTLVDVAIHDVREMSQLLRPTVLDDFGLDAALRALADRFGQRTGIHVDYASNVAELRLRDEAETHLFRIAQEALTNIARHAGATSVAIALHVDRGELRLTVKDNGRGWQERGAQSAGSGLGLAGMKTRARGCGGELVIQSEAGKGFSIAVSCPVAATAV